MTGKVHEDLEVWKMSVELATAIYQFTKSFPEEEKYGLVSQMRRSAVSIASNIAEGAARQGSKEFLQYLSIASGSASELSTQLVIADRVGLGNKEELNDLKSALKRISMMLQGLMRSVRSKNNNQENR